MSRRRHQVLIADDDFKLVKLLEFVTKLMLAEESYKHFTNKEVIKLALEAYATTTQRNRHKGSNMTEARITDLEIEYSSLGTQFHNLEDRLREMETQISEIIGKLQLNSQDDVVECFDNRISSLEEQLSLVTVED